MNWFMIAGGLLVIIGIVFLIRYLIGNTTGNGEKTKSPEVPIESSIKSKMSYRKIWVWSFIVVIIFTIIGLSLFFSKHNKTEKSKSLSFQSQKEKETHAIFIWTLDPSQHGKKRTSGPKQALITKNNKDEFNFVVYYYHKGRKEKSVFEGERTALGRIEGFWWQQNPRDGGKWYLDVDSVNKRLFTGKHSDTIGEQTQIMLKIKLN